MKHVAYILLGSNMGDRKQKLQQAMERIAKDAGSVTSSSSIYETEPWGVKEQAFFLNQVIEIKTEMAPAELLMALKKTEEAIGRTGQTKWGPREIDIDILYYDELIIDTENLKIPHPQIPNRNFVLIPLMEIAGDYIDPLTQRTVDDIYDQSKDSSEVFIFE